MCAYMYIVYICKSSVNNGLSQLYGVMFHNLLASVNDKSSFNKILL